MTDAPPNRWPRRLIYAGVVAVIALSGYFISDSVLKRVEQPGYCPTCHETRPQYIAWKYSAHSRIDCLICHGGDNSTLKRWARRRVEARNAVLHLLGKSKYPYRPTLVPENRACGQCHSANREVTPSGDLIIPHREHTTVTGTPCAACHVDVVHARAGKRMDQALEKAGGRMEPAFKLLENELKNLGPKEHRPLMGACMSCHNGKKAPSACAACHKELDVPANHKAADWSYKHGGAARKDIKGCVYCHAVLLDVARPGEDITLIQGVRGNPFCINCHTKLPVTHGSDFKLKHKFRAEQDLEGCLVCHDAKAKGSAEQDIVTCGECHKTPVTHPENYRKIHPKVVARQGAAKCFHCHDTTSCSYCHTGGMVSGSQAAAQ
ncbi:MAG: cytochrome c3 family protein [Bacillota bacterium]